MGAGGEVKVLQAYLRARKTWGYRRDRDSLCSLAKMPKGDLVAVKKIRARRPLPNGLGDPWSKSAAREVQVLKRLQHPNIVKLFDHSEVVQAGASECQE